jgi:sulfide:quinone oxidoreductase
MAVHGEVDGVSATAQRVLVAGAGVAGLETALALRALAPSLASVELLAPEREFVYRPLAVAEPFRVGEARRFPLERLVAAAGARLRQGTLSELDWKQKRVLLCDGSVLEYGVLVLALGAQALEAIPGALTFRGHQDGQALEALLERATGGELKQIAFALPAGSTWPLPLYELALLTAAYLADHLTRGVEVVLVTPEQRPLQAFGRAASDAIEQLLAIRGIRLETSTVATRWHGGQLELDNGSQIAADAAVALPRLQGTPIAGLPQDEHGFVATDEFGWVLGLTDVYAAGDLTQSSIKQGGIAAQQADAVASAIASDLGAHTRPREFRPVLRGLLLTGGPPRFLREGSDQDPAQVSTQPLWWPPAKIVGRYLSPFLADQLGLKTDYPEPPHDIAIPIEIALESPTPTDQPTANR